MQYQLTKGWSVLQDVHEFGEHFGIFKHSFDPTRFGGDSSIQPLEPWEPIDRLEHLQLTFAQNPLLRPGVAYLQLRALVV